MAQYSLHCGDQLITKVDYTPEIVGCLSKVEQDDIQALGKATQAYKNFDNWIGFGYMEIKRCI